MLKNEHDIHDRRQHDVADHSNNREGDWNQRSDKKPIVQWIVLATILALLAYLASS